MGVSNIEGGSGNSVAVQQRSDRSAQDNVLSEEAIDTPQIPRFIYSKLGNLTNHKTISLEDMETEQNEYKFFMMELNRFFESEADIDNIAALDEYLGSLGIDREYPFKDDTLNIPAWIEYGDKQDDRNIITLDSDIVYNVITTVGGIDYNVIHDIDAELEI